MELARFSPFLAAFFFRFAHAALIFADIILRYAASLPEVFSFATTLTLAVVALGVAAGAVTAAFANLTFAHLAFVAATIASLPAALSFRFAGGLGAGAVTGVEACSTDDDTAFRPEPGGRPCRFVGP